MSAPKIPDGPEWDIVRDAFKGARLDLNNPEHWPFLLKGYVETVHQRARSGPKRRWTDERLIKLASDFSRVQHDHPDKSDSDICRFLVKGEDYSELSAETLRRKLQDARDPECNALLDRLINAFATHYEVEGGNTREQLRAWLTTGITHVWEDKIGRLHFTPPEPPPIDAPVDWPGRQAIRLVPKK
jgi:hypothetical protein